MSRMGSADSTDEMENDIERELQKLEQIFDDENYLLEYTDENHDNRTRLNNGTSRLVPKAKSKHILKQEQSRRENYTAYDIAAAEGDREELQDRLHMLLSKMEVYDKLAEQLNIRNTDLIRKNETLINENQQLRSEIIELKSSSAVKDTISHDMNSLTSAKIDHVFSQLEHKLADTRSQLARSQQSVGDLEMHRERLLEQLDEEENRRMHAEKERDVYSEAYEQSLMHFDKWMNDSKRNQETKTSKFESVKKSFTQFGSPNTARTVESID
jgi:hypothetical protein